MIELGPLFGDIRPSPMVAAKSFLPLAEVKSFECFLTLSGAFNPCKKLALLIVSALGASIREPNCLGLSKLFVYTAGWPIIAGDYYARCIFILKINK